MDSFDYFWANYPVHRAKKDAKRAWEKLNPSIDLTNTIVQAVVAQITWRRQQTDQRKWVPEWALPATWIRGERWHDELPGLTVTRKTVIVFEGEEHDVI